MTKPLSRTVRLWTCSNCGKEEQWGPTWSVWYPGRRMHGRNAYYDPEPTEAACCDECRAALDEKRGK